MKRVLFIFISLIIFLFPISLEAQDLSGGPLPEPWITEEDHLAVLTATNLSSIDFPKMDHAYWHWIASGHTLGWLAFFHAMEIADLLIQLDECRNPPAPSTPTCSFISDFKDGAGGALWKPESDNTGNPVILYPSELTGNLFQGSCEVFDNTLRKFLNCPFRTVANGGREHYDVPRRASRLDGRAPLLVRIRYKDGTFDCRTVPIPSERFD